MLSVSITQEQVKDSPEIDTDLPVSRQHEIRYLAYCGYPFHWGGGTAPSTMMTGYVGFESKPHAVERAEAKTCAHAEPARHPLDDPHLHSCKTIIGCHIEANDGDIGHLQYLLVDEESRAIRNLAVNPGNW